LKKDRKIPGVGGKKSLTTRGKMECVPGKAVFSNGGRRRGIHQAEKVIGVGSTTENSKGRTLGENPARTTDRVFEEGRYAAKKRVGEGTKRIRCIEA